MIRIYTLIDRCRKTEKIAYFVDTSQSTIRNNPWFYSKK